MTQKLLDVEAFRAAAKDGHAPDGPLFKFATTEPEVVGGAGSRIRRFIFSDSTVDHSNDVINQAGWDLSVFKRNPVALFGHASWEPPIGKASNVLVQNNRLVGDIEFASEAVYPFANTIFELVKGGFLKAVSVGFLPKEWKFSSDKNRPNGLDFIRQLLAEISVVPIPANPSALIEARSIGIDTRPLKTWAERILDGGDMGVMPRRALETLRGQAGEPARHRTKLSPAPPNHPLHQTIDDVSASIGATRQAIKDVQACLASSDEPKLDEVQLKLAVGHFSGAIASKNMAIACMRAALASAADDSEPVTSNPDDAAAKRLAEAKALRRSVAAETPEQRLERALALKRQLGAPTKTRAERLAHVEDIRRRLRAEGLI